MTEAVTFLVGTGVLSVVEDDASAKRLRPQTDKINAYLVSKALRGVEIVHIASPLTAGGIVVNRNGQMILEALNQGITTPAGLAQYSWNKLLAQGQRLFKDGKPIAAADENIAELTRLAQIFESQILPIWKVLQLA